MSNLKVLRDEVAFKSHLSTGNAAELAEIDKWLNEAYVDIMLRTNCRVEHGTVATTVDEWRYDLPTAAMDVVEVWMEAADGETTPFEKTDSQHIIRLRAGLETETGSPPRFYSTEGSNMLLIWPTASAADTINLLYVPRPSTLAATGDQPSDVPDEFHRGLELYALWQAGDADDSANSQKGAYWRVLYEGEDGMGGYLDRIRKHMRRRAGRRLPPLAFTDPLRRPSPSADLHW